MSQPQTLSTLHKTIPAFSGNSFVHTRDEKQLVQNIKPGDYVNVENDKYVRVKYVIKIEFNQPINTIEFGHMNACTLGPNTPDKSYVSFGQLVHIYAGLFGTAKSLNMPDIHESDPAYDMRIKEYEKSEEHMQYFKHDALYNFVLESDHCVQLGSECMCATWGYNPMSHDYTSNNKDNQKPRDSIKNKSFDQLQWFDTEENYMNEDVIIGYDYCSHDYQTDGIPIAFMHKAGEEFYDPYFGSNQCVGDLAKLSNDGYINLIEENFEFDSTLAHVIRIITCDEHLLKKQKK